MKHLLSVLALILVFTSCKEAKKEVLTTQVHGTILNNSIDTLQLSRKQMKVKVAVNKDGTFSMDAPIETAGTYTLRGGKLYTELYLTPNSDIQVDFDAQDPAATISYGGAARVTNEYLATKGDYLFENGLDFNQLMYMGADSIVMHAKLVQEDLDNKLHENLPADFVVTQKRFNQYQMQNELSNAAFYRELYAEDGEKDESGIAMLLETMGSVDLENVEDFIDNRAYNSIVNNEFMKHYYSGSEDTTVPGWKHGLNYIQNVKADYIKNRLARSINYELSPGKDGMENIYNALRETYTEDDMIAALDEKWAKIQKLSKGMPSPDFDYENYAGGNTTLTDLNGKYTYIDVWATWCGPCLGEIPSLKKLEHDFEGKNINFVSISIDESEDYQAWRDMIEKKALGGIQLMSPNQWQSEFVQDYVIDGIPRFILLDPQGNIVNADAPRPSSIEIREQFEALSI